MRPARLFLLGLVFLSLLMAALQWSSAPPIVPSHFDAAGRPNAWSSRNAFFALEAGVSLGIAALFLALPILLKLTPVSLINLPNKAYWLASERRDETMDRLASYFDVFASATVLLLLVVFQLAARASRGAGLDSNYFLPALVAYLAFSLVWTVALIRKFASPPESR